MAEGTSVELFTGALTFHFIDQGSSQMFRNKISKEGRLIYNPMFGIRYLTEDPETYFAAAAFAGNNSVGLPMAGTLFSMGIKDTSDHYFLGLSGGLYVQDNNKFREHQAIPFKIYETKGGVGFVPIVGLEMGVKVGLWGKTYFKFYNLLTPVVNSSFLLLGYSF